MSHRTPVTTIVHTIKSHSLRCFIYRPELQERKVFVEIYLARQHRIADGLSKSREMHLLVEKLHHLLFGHAEWNISNVKSKKRDKRLDKWLDGDSANLYLLA